MSDNLSSASVTVSATEPLVLANGIRGFPGDSQPDAATSPRSSRARQGAVTLNAQAFLPDGADGPVPMVLLVPGSTGINTSHLKHAATLTCAGIGACVSTALARAASPTPTTTSAC